MSEDHDDLVRAVVERYAMKFMPLPTIAAGVRGWLEERRSIWCLCVRRWPTRDADIEALVLDDVPLASSLASGKVVYLNAIYLPESCQGRGVGRHLVETLVPLWRLLGVREVVAAAGTDAGAMALPAWGFRESPEAAFGLPMWRLAIT